MFFNGFNEYTREAFNSDKDRHNVISWILYNTNYCEEEYNGLKTGQCSFSFTTIETECNIKHTRAINIMKKLEEDGFVEWVFKSKTRHKNSILGLKQETSKRTSEKTSEKTSKGIENTSVEGYKEPVKELVKEPVKEPSSIKLSKKQSIYDEIFQFWNSKNIVKHRKLSVKMEKAIDKVLKDYSKEEIIKNISRYAVVIHDDNYYFDMSWDLDVFLKQENAMNHFTEQGSKWISYQNDLRKRSLKNNVVPMRKTVGLNYNDEEFIEV